MFKKPIIAICLFKYFPHGGLQKDTVKVCKQLIQDGFFVRIYVNKWSGDKISNDNLEIVVLRNNKITNHAQNTQFAIDLQAHIKSKPVDVVFGFNKMPKLDYYFAADVCYKQSKNNSSFLYQMSKRYKHYIEFEQEVFKQDAKTHIFIITQVQKADFIKHYQTQNDRFTLVAPGIDDSFKGNFATNEQRLTWLNNNGFNEEDKIILQIGSDYKRKGVSRSLRAISQLDENVKKRVKFLVIGRCKYTIFYKMLAKKLSVEKQVFFYQGRDDILEIIKYADVLLHPAHLEAGGIVILEALASGVPVIASDVCGFAFYVKQANAGFVVDNNNNIEQELSSRLEDLFTNKDLLKTLKQNAQKFSLNADIYNLAKQISSFIKNKLQV